MNRPKLLAVGVLLAVFGMGTIAGGAAMATWQGRLRRDVARLGFGPHGDRPIMAMMRRLDLDRDQHRAIEELLVKHAPQRRAIMQEMMSRCGQELEKEKAQLDSEIRAILSPAQQQRFDDLSSRQRERMFGPQGPPLRNPR